MPIHLKREKLYSQIWSRPIGYLARDFGVNSARLRVACKLMAIPIPVAGHWAAVRADCAEAPPPLLQHNGPDSITLDGKARETLVEWIERTHAPVSATTSKAAPARAASVKPAAPAQLGRA